MLVGINLLREGLDLPEVSLVSILDADKEGFLRSGTSLIQTIGRAARNVSGEVHMYADKITAAMASAIEETNRRREKQVAYNVAHGIDPDTAAQADQRHDRTCSPARTSTRQSCWPAAIADAGTGGSGGPARGGRERAPRPDVAALPATELAESHPGAERSDARCGRGAPVRARRAAA